MAEKSTAFAVIGDRYHNSDYIRTALGKTLVGDLGLTIDFTDDVKSLNAETLRGYKMLITFRDGMIWPQGYGAGGSLPPNVSDPPVPEVEATAVDWITQPQAQAVKDFVEERRRRAVLSQFDLHRQRQRNLSRSVRGSNRRTSASSTIQGHTH